MSLVFCVIEKTTKIEPANNILQQTSQAGSKPFCSKRNWAQVPDPPHNTAEVIAISRPGSFWVFGIGEVKPVEFACEDISKMQYFTTLDRDLPILILTGLLGFNEESVFKKIAVWEVLIFTYCRRSKIYVRKLVLYFEN